MVGLVFIDLVSAHKPYQYLTNPAFVYESPKVIRSPEPEPNRLFYYPGLAYLHPNYYSILRQPSFPELHSIVFSNLVPNTGVFHGFDYMQELDALRRWPYLAFLTAANKMPWDQLYRLLGALNVKYIVSFRELSGGGITLVHHFPEHPSWLYRLDRFVPRASVVARATQEKDPVKVLKRLSSEEFDPMREVFLEEPLPLPAQDDFRAQAKILSYTNHKVTIRASLNGPGVLVLADSFYPGWRAYVNGKEEKILRANVFFRAVPLTAGEHLIEFRYEPRSFAIGLAVSLMFLAAIAIWSTYLFVPRK